MAITIYFWHDKNIKCLKYNITLLSHELLKSNCLHLPMKRYATVFIWAETWDFQQCCMCNQQRLRPACSFGVSKLKRRLHTLIWVYTCQNATLLETTCHGSIILLMKRYAQVKYRFEFYFSTFMMWWGQRKTTKTGFSWDVVHTTALIVVSLIT